MDARASIWRALVPLAAQLAEDFRDEEFQHQVVALHVRGRKVLGYGVNQKRYAKYSSYFDDSLHAEADLIRRHGEKLRGGKVFLYRFNNAPGSPLANQPLCAKPCPLCSHLLNEAGVGRVVWVDELEEVVSIRARDFPLMAEHPSILTRLFIEKVGTHHGNKFYPENYMAH